MWEDAKKCFPLSPHTPHTPPTSPAPLHLSYPLPGSWVKISGIRAVSRNTVEMANNANDPPDSVNCKMKLPIVVPKAPLAPATAAAIAK